MRVSQGSLLNPTQELNLLHITACWLGQFCSDAAGCVIHRFKIILPMDGAARAAFPKSCPLGKRMAASKTEISLTRRVRTATSCSWVRHLFSTGSQKLAGEGTGGGAAGS